MPDNRSTDRSADPDLYAPTPAGYLRVGLKMLFEAGKLSEEDLRLLLEEDTRHQLKTCRPVLTDNLDRPLPGEAKKNRGHYCKSEDFLLSLRTKTLWVTTEVTAPALQPVTDYFARRGLSAEKVLMQCRSMNIRNTSNVKTQDFFRVLQNR